MIRAYVLAVFLFGVLSGVLFSVAKQQPVDFRFACVMNGKELTESARLPFSEVYTCGKETVLVKVTR